MDSKYKVFPLRLIATLMLLILLILDSARAKNACFEALLLCARVMIPSLFPFFVLSAFLTRLGLPGVLGRLVAPFACTVYGISPAGASALMLGFIGGYPAGANYIAEMEKGGMIDSDEGERLMAFCNNSGPAFIVGVMGSGIFGSVKTGLLLYSVHIFSALMTGLFFRGKAYSLNIAPHALDVTDTGEAIVASVKQAAAAIINVCSFVVCFSVLLELLDTGHVFSSLCGAISGILNLEPKFVKAALSGILELGSASAAMQGLSASPFNLALAAAILSWGGLSVHFQSLAVLSESRIKGTLHLTGRLLSAIIAFITMYLISFV